MEFVYDIGLYYKQLRNCKEQVFSTLKVMELEEIY